MFRPFRTLLHKIRSLLWTLDRRELVALERLLCTNEDVSSLAILDIPQGKINGRVRVNLAHQGLCTNFYLCQNNSL